MNKIEATQAITSAQVSNIPLRPPGLGASAEGAAGEAAARAQLSAGVAAANEDGASRAPTASQQAVDAEYNQQLKIQPQPNVLDKFASYTYQASVYLLTNTQYERLINGKSKSTDGLSLLFQTGGAGPAPNRNQFFDHDFYIDSITIENSIAGKQTGAAHMSTDIKFTVIEPQGITMLDRLYKAVEQLAPTDGAGAVNYSAAVYMMVISFYGYDINGNPITAKSSQLGSGADSAVVRKFIPFLIRGLKWSVGNKAVTYEFEGAPIGQLVAGSTARGTVPYDIELTNSTVAGVLAGNVNFSKSESQLASEAESELQRESRGRQTTAPSKADSVQQLRRIDNAILQTTAPPKANAAPSDKKTLTNGLMAALNKIQNDLVQRKVYTVADQYEIVFEKGAEEIMNAKIVLSDNQKVDKAGTPQNQSATADASALLPEKQFVDAQQRNKTITAGQQILQVIELIIRNSSFVYDQSLVIVKPDGSQVPNPNAKNKPLKWFLISMQAVPITETIDPLRNDHAYRITYTISAYEIPNFESRYFPLAQFPGLHKKYNWLFTGQNNAVLDYTAELNSFYHVTVSGSPDFNNDIQRRKFYTSSMREIPRYVYMATSSEAGSGGPGRSNEVSANAAEYLYSPGDLHTAKLKIVGDPAWIQQGRSIFETTTGSNGFLNDGTIDFDSSQVFFELAWQRPEDYNLTTGLADPYSVTEKKYNNRESLQSNVYQAFKVVNEFRQGKFEQELHGTLYFFPKPDGTNAVAGATVEQSVSGTERSVNQNRALSAARTPNISAEVARRTGVNLNSTAGAGRGSGAAQILDQRVRDAATSVTSAEPSSQYAKGVQQVLNTPKTSAAPTEEQLRSSAAYITARRSAATHQAALEVARQSFAITAGGSPVTSNGSAVAQTNTTAPSKANAAQQLRRIDNATLQTTAPPTPQATNREF